MLGDDDMNRKIEEKEEEIVKLKEQIEKVRKEEKVAGAREWGSRLKEQQKKVADLEKQIKEGGGGGEGGEKWQ